MAIESGVRWVDVDAELPRRPVATHSRAEEAEFLGELRRGVIGHDARVTTPEGEKPLLYFDWIASGRFHRAIEDELNSRVLPLMANTHTETSATGRAMTAWYERALRRIGACLGANAEDVVLPVGSGSTRSFSKLAYAKSRCA